MQGEYEFVSKKEARPFREELENIIREVQRICREKDRDFTFQYYLVGSQGRHLVTRIKNGNAGYDFDYNLVLNCEDGYSWKPVYARKTIFGALQEAIKGSHFTKIENSTSVITIKYVEGDRVVVGCDFSVIYYPKDDESNYYKYVRFNKGDGTYTWEVRKPSHNIDDKLEWLKENVEDYWNEIIEEYLWLKNHNQDPNKHSFVLYHEAVNNLYNHYCQKSKDNHRDNGGLKELGSVEQTLSKGGCF